MPRIRPVGAMTEFSEKSPDFTGSGVLKMRGLGIPPWPGRGRPRGSLPGFSEGGPPVQAQCRDGSTNGVREHVHRIGLAQGHEVLVDFIGHTVCSCDRDGGADGCNRHSTAKSSDDRPNEQRAEPTIQQRVCVLVRALGQRGHARDG